jgi:hypothetical protein
MDYHYFDNSSDLPPRMNPLIYGDTAFEQMVSLVNNFGTGLRNGVVVLSYGLDWLAEMGCGHDGPAFVQAELPEFGMIGDLTKLAEEEKGLESTLARCPTKAELHARFPRRSPWRAGVRDAVYEGAQNSSFDGKVYDPYTGKEIHLNDPWEFGHDPRYKFGDWQRRAWYEGWSPEEWNDFLNDPGAYRPETPFTNAGHYAEDPYW